MPFIFVLPNWLLYFSYFKEKKSAFEMLYTDQTALMSYSRTVGLCVVMTTALIGFSAFLEGSWDFIGSTYGFM